MFYVLHRASNEITDPSKLGIFKVFLMDEAWLFIRNETIRNYVVSGTKDLAQAQRGDDSRHPVDQGAPGIGDAADRSESCPTKIFLANPDMDREVYREAFHLNDTELELIAGLVPPGQMLIRKAQSSKKVHLNVDSVSHWIATNNARDNLIKREYFARFGIAEGCAVSPRTIHFPQTTHLRRHRRCPPQPSRKEPSHEIRSSRSQPASAVSSTGLWPGPHPRPVPFSITRRTSCRFTPSSSTRR